MSSTLRGSLCLPRRDHRRWRGPHFLHPCNNGRISCASPADSAWFLTVVVSAHNCLRMVLLTFTQQPHEQQPMASHGGSFDAPLACAAGTNSSSGADSVQRTTTSARMLAIKCTFHLFQSASMHYFLWLPSLYFSHRGDPTLVIRRTDWMPAGIPKGWKELPENYEKQHDVA